MEEAARRKGRPRSVTTEGEEGGYLREGKRVGHRTDKDLTQFPVQVGTLNPVQVGVNPEDPAGGSTESAVA